MGSVSSRMAKGGSFFGMVLVYVLGGVAIGYFVAIMHIFTRLSIGPLVLKQHRDGSRTVMMFRKEI